jgi:hypothetical protein
MIYVGYDLLAEKQMIQHLNHYDGQNTEAYVEGMLPTMIMQ